METLIAYATQPGDTAADGEGWNDLHHEVGRADGPAIVQFRRIAEHGKIRLNHGIYILVRGMNTAGQPYVEGRDIHLAGFVFQIITELSMQ